MKKATEIMQEFIAYLRQGLPTHLEEFSFPMRARMAQTSIAVRSDGRLYLSFQFTRLHLADLPYLKQMIHFLVSHHYSLRAVGCSVEGFSRFAAETLYQLSRAIPRGCSFMVLNVSVLFPNIPKKVHYAQVMSPTKLFLMKTTERIVGKRNLSHEEGQELHKHIAAIPTLLTGFFAFCNGMSLGMVSFPVELMVGVGQQLFPLFTRADLTILLGLFENQRLRVSHRVRASSKDSAEEYALELSRDPESQALVNYVEAAKTPIIHVAEVLQRASSERAYNAAL